MKERIRFYRRQRAAEGYLVGKEGQKRKKPVQDGTILRELVTLRASLKFATTGKWIKEAPYIEVLSQPPPRDRWLTRDEADGSASGSDAGAPRPDLPSRLTLHGGPDGPGNACG